MKKLEFSKIILAVLGAIALAVTVTTLIFAFAFGSTDAIVCLVTAVFAELATATGFYYHKAKRENEIKLRKKYGAEIYKDTKENSSDVTEDNNYEY